MRLIWLSGLSCSSTETLLSILPILPDFGSQERRLPPGLASGKPRISTALCARFGRTLFMESTEWTQHWAVCCRFNGACCGTCSLIPIPRVDLSYHPLFQRRKGPDQDLRAHFFGAVGRQPDR